VSKLPAIMFYPADWLNDIKLQSCSLGAQGLLVNLMCLMHQSKKYGYLLINGDIPNDRTVIKLLRIHHKTYQSKLKELLSYGVLCKDKNGAIFSKRMVEDEMLRQVRQFSGSLGGNPAMPEFRKKAGYVYAIKRLSDSLVKIGIATNIQNRLYKIKSKHKCEIEIITIKQVDCMGDAEDVLYERYKDKKVDNTWFNLSDKDILKLRG